MTTGDFYIQERINAMLISGSREPKNNLLPQSYCYGVPNDIHSSHLKEGQREKEGTVLGNAKPYFTLIAQSPNRAEIEQAAASYEKSHPGTKVVIDHWRDHLTHLDNEGGLWRARVRINEHLSFSKR